MTGTLKWSFLIREEKTGRLLDNMALASMYTFSHRQPWPDGFIIPTYRGPTDDGLRAVSDIRPILDNV